MTNHPTHKAAMELLEIAAKATPGPWHWRESSSGRIDLAAPHGGGTTVMDFARKGLQGAQPRFAVCFDSEPRGKRGGIMRTAAEIMEKHDGLLRNDDAEAIATLPDLAAELRATLDRETALMAEVDRLRGYEKPISLASYGQSQPGNGLPAYGIVLDMNTPKPAAWQGRQTGRNRPDIPSDAGVPPRCDAINLLERDEQFAQECGGTIVVQKLYDESGADAGCGIGEES